MTRSIVMERVFDYAPERVWRPSQILSALADWLMENDFQPVLGRAFTFRTKPGPGFDGIVRCRVTGARALQRPCLYLGQWTARNARHMDPSAGRRGNAASNGALRLRGHSRVFPSAFPVRGMEADRSRSSRSQSGRPCRSLPHARGLRRICTCLPTCFYPFK